jgi:glycosyltransferase involved in cell wall biosynthesis
MSSVYLAPIAKLQGIKFVNGYIGQAPLKITTNDYIRNLLTFFISDAIVSNSMAGLKAYNAPAEKSICIYNGMDFKRFEDLKPIKTVKQEILGNENDESFIVAMVAAFEKRKDYETFVRAAVKLCKINESIKFLLIGGGNYIDTIKGMVPAEYLDKRILLPGRISQVENVLQIIDIGVLLTNSKVHGEGVSNSVIEYMASAKPVIATRGGGTDEVVFDGVNGFLVDYAADDQVVEKVQILFNDRNKVKEMGKKGYDMAHEKFDVVNMSQNYVNLYLKLLAAD